GCSSAALEFLCGERPRGLPVPVDMRRPGDTGKDSKLIPSGYARRWGISQRHRAACLQLRDERSGGRGVIGALLAKSAYFALIRSAPARAAAVPEGGPRRS